MNSFLRRYGYVLLATLLVFLVALAPARLLPVLLPEGFLQSTGVIRGSFWKGSASSVIVAINDNSVALGATHWRINPLSILLLSPAVEINSQWRQQRLLVELELNLSGEVDIERLSLSVPAGIAKHWVPLNLGGEVILNANQIRIIDGHLNAGEGLLRWQNASWRADTGTVLLGNYQALVAIADNTVKLSVDNKDQPVGVSGWLQWSSSAYGTDLEIVSQHPAIGNAVSLVATENENGYRLKVSSS